MAKQKSIIKLEGTLGDITFHKSKYGYLAKEKTTVSADRIATDPAFQRTRENGAEFGRAGKAGKILRNSLRSSLQKAKDSRMVGRLTKEMMKVIKADTASLRGLRNVVDGDLSLLRGFEFNQDARLSTTLYAPFTVDIDRAAGTLTVSLPSFIPGHMIAAPGGATHFRILSAGSEIDFEAGVYNGATADSAILPLSQVATAALSLVNNVPAGTTNPLFLAIGIEFMQEVNSQMYPLNNGSFNALSLVEVSVG